MSLACASVLAGCAKYYKVTDRAHGDVYYTDSFPARSYAECGRASFVDVRTGAVVTLDNARVEQVGRRRGHRSAMASAPDID